jgi:hypothetical protein
MVPEILRTFLQIDREFHKNVRTFLEIVRALHSFVRAFPENLRAFQKVVRTLLKIGRAFQENASIARISATVPEKCAQVLGNFVSIREKSACVPGN